MSITLEETKVALVTQDLDRIVMPKEQTIPMLYRVRRHSLLGMFAGL